MTCFCIHIEFYFEKGNIHVCHIFVFFANKLNCFLNVIVNAKMTWHSFLVVFLLQYLFIAFMHIAIRLIFVHLYAHISFPDDLRYAAVPFAA